MSNRNHYSHNDHLAFADRDAARAMADLRALGAPEFAEPPERGLRRLLSGRRRVR